MASRILAQSLFNFKQHFFHLQQHKMIRKSGLLIIVFTVLLAGCSTQNMASKPAKKPFYGTIVYDVTIETLKNADNQLLKNKKGIYGNEMTLTFFENGNILRKYNGTQPNEFSEYFVNLSDNQIIEHSVELDSTLVFSANQQNVRKLNSLRLSKDSLSVLGYPCKEIGISVEEVDLATYEKRYLTLNYWYSNQIRVDKARYNTINADLWSFLFNESDGGIFLKYEKNYYDFKVTYTAKEIRKKDFLEEENQGLNFIDASN
jgi:hypothetical protein